jgi:hypothetical protein
MLTTLPDTLFKIKMQSKRNFQKRNNVLGRGQDDPDKDQTMVNLNQLANRKCVFFRDICPARVFTKLKFICNRRLTNAGGQIASIQFNANGAYDFDPAVASNQVAGFDEWSALYDRYRVYAVRAKVDFTMGDDIPAVVGISFNPKTYTTNTYGLTHMDGPNSVTRLTGGKNVVPIRLKKFCNALQVVGDEVCYTEFNYTGNLAGNPTALWYVNICADISPSGLAFTTGLYVRAEFDIYTEFFERYDVDSSLESINARILNLENKKKRFLMGLLDQKTTPLK